MLNIQPNHSILEIGCGTGLLAEEICNRLPGGKFVGIDRSAAMIEKAMKRNHASIETAKASFLMSEFKDVTVPKSSFHTIAAFNVNFFWQDPTAELQIIRSALKPAGTLFVFYQSPFEIDASAAEPIKQQLLKHSFEIISIDVNKLKPTSAFCITTKPAHR